MAGWSTVSRPAPERFAEKYTVDENGCWVWQGWVKENGYGQFFEVRGKSLYAHRWSYEHHVGPLAPGLELHHTCKNRRCVNPGHLLPMTTTEHGALSRVTHCKWGHPYDQENTGYARSGARFCRACRAGWEQRRTDKRRALPTCKKGHPRATTEQIIVTQRGKTVSRCKPCAQEAGHRGGTAKGRNHKNRLLAQQKFMAEVWGE